MTARRLASWAAGLSIDAIPETTRRAALRHLLDGIGNGIGARRLGQGGYGFFDLDGVHSSALVQLVQFDLEAIFVHADAFAGAVHQVLEMQRLGVQLA